MFKFLSFLIFTTLFACAMGPVLGDDALYAQKVLRFPGAPPYYKVILPIDINNEEVGHGTVNITEDLLSEWGIIGRTNRDIYEAAATKRQETPDAIVLVAYPIPLGIEGEAYALLQALQFGLQLPPVADPNLPVVPMDAIIDEGEDDSGED